MSLESAGVLIGVLIQLGAAIYVYGRLTEKVKGHGDRILSLETGEAEQWRSINKHGERIARLEGGRIQ